MMSLYDSSASWEELQAKRCERDVIREASNVSVRRALRIQARRAVSKFPLCKASMIRRLAAGKGYRERWEHRTHRTF